MLLTFRNVIAVSGVLLGLFSADLALSQSVSWHAARTGVRLSSVDIDDVSFDDTLGIGLYTEVPMDMNIKLGVAADYWRTEDRYTRTDNLRDFAVAGFGKYYFLSHLVKVAPYAVAGVGMHFVKFDQANAGANRNRKSSLDIGAGFDAKITSYVSLNGEVKMRNMDRHDYTDYAVGAVAKF